MAKEKKRQIGNLEKQIAALLDRIMQATNDKVIGAYEAKIGELERSRARLHEDMTCNPLRRIGLRSC